MIILPAPCIIYCMLNDHTAVAIRKARRLANDCRSGGTTGAPNA
nr:MAG TPA_asm: hypothetical protein [Caudoviricetes sp.]